MKNAHLMPVSADFEDGILADFVPWRLWLSNEICIKQGREKTKNANLMPVSSNFEDGILSLGFYLKFLLYLHSVFNITSYRF